MEEHDVAKDECYERWYMCNTYVSNFPSLQRGFSPSLRETWQRRKLKDTNKEENWRIQTKKRQINHGKNDNEKTKMTTKRRERW